MPTPVGVEEDDELMPIVGTPPGLFPGIRVDTVRGGPERPRIRTPQTPQSRPTSVTPNRPNRAARRGRANANRGVANPRRNSGPRGGARQLAPGRGVRRAAERMRRGRR